MRDWQSIDWAEAFSRLHPVLLHLPIGLFVALAWLHFWGLFGSKGKERGAGRSALVWLLVLSTPTAAASGWFLHEGASYPDPVEWHEWGGIALAFLAVFVGVAHWRRSSWYGPLVWISLAALIPTAHFGASLTHGEEFLLEPWLEEEEESDAPAGVTPPIASESTRSEPRPNSLAETGTEQVAANLEEDVDVPAAPSFADVEPILEEMCYRCHGVRKQRGGLALHTVEAALLGGDSGPAIVQGDAGASLLITRMRLPLEHEDHMPPENKSQPTAQQIERIAAWLDGRPEQTLSIQESAEDDAPDPESEASEVPEETGAIESAPEAGDLAAAIDALRARRVHVQPLETGSSQLWVDFGAVEFTAGELGAMLSHVKTNVVDLSLARQALAAADFEFLGELTSLERLDLRRSVSEDVDLSPLVGLKNLRVLNLAGTPLPAGSEVPLAELESLERLYLWETGLDEASLVSLRERRPALDIIGASANPDEPLEVEPEVEFVKHEETAESPVADESLTATTKNKTCPVSGGAVDPRYTVLHEGRAIGFCCPNCPKTFWEDPAPFLAKLDDL